MSTSQATWTDTADDESPDHGALDDLLRHPERVIERIEAGTGLAHDARIWIAVAVLSTALFGGAMGAFRGGWQILFASVKLPIVTLLTAGLVAPVFSGARMLLTGSSGLRRDFALVLAALARGSLVLAALTPVFLLGVSLDASYHKLVLTAVAICTAGGLVGFGMLLRGLRDVRLAERGLTLAVLFTALVLVGAQMAWTLRPYLIRPRTPDVPFVRAVEGSFFDAVAGSVDSARDVFHRPQAPLPGTRR